MKSQEKSKKDFSIIFEKIESYSRKDSSIEDNIISSDILQEDESIRAFSEICRKINSNENNPTIFTTFS